MEVERYSLVVRWNYPLFEMRSEHVDEFNHDPWASEYDLDVQNEDHPIREGYGQLLSWIAEKAQISQGSRVLELGSGTGNLSKLLPCCRELVSVDVSKEMECIAAIKCSHISNRRFIEDDILSVFDREDLDVFNTVVTSYTVHHLTEPEKLLFFKKVWDALEPNGVAVFGDLMVENQKAKEDRIGHYEKTKQNDVVEALREEFFWDIETCSRALRSIGFKFEIQRFSDLSYGIFAMKP